MRKILLRLVFLIYVLGQFFFCSCEKFANVAPQADFTVFPEVGDLSTVFIFNAGYSTDDQTEGWGLRSRWDADSDGIWDSKYSIRKQFAYQFHSEGDHTITLEVIDSGGLTHQITKSVKVISTVIDSTIVDARDSRVYKVVRLYGRWWMAESLKFGGSLQTDEFPEDNGLVEKYDYTLESGESGIYGSYYTWDEATHYKRDTVVGICPDGWRLPRTTEVQEFMNLLWFSRDLSSYMGPEGRFHIDLQLAGVYFLSESCWHQQNQKGYFWINSQLYMDRFTSLLSYSQNDTMYMINDYIPFSSRILEWKEKWTDFTFTKLAVPVRCIKE